MKSLQELNDWLGISTINTKQKMTKHVQKRKKKKKKNYQTVSYLIPNRAPSPDFHAQQSIAINAFLNF